MLEYANRIGVPAPQLLNYKGNAMVLEHLRGYKAVDSTNFGMGMQFGRDIPVEIKKNFIAVVRTMHLEGMAHNDLHMGNIMVGLASRRVKLIDFGLASLRSDTENAVPFRDGRGSNLLKEELSSIPYKLNLPDATTNLVQTRYKRALQLVEDIADSENGYGRARNRSGINLHWDTAEFIINRYYNDLTRAVEAQPVARSRSVASIIQPKLPGFDRARLKARWNTEQAAGLQGWGKDALYDIAQQMGVAPSAFESFLLSAKNKK
jgi:tRNA A-37 threonylcarbamoyl transferase component Bud32